MPRAAGRTDVGRCRAVNEDTFGIVATAGALAVGVYDGTGSFEGETAREAASFEAARVVREAFTAAPPPGSSEEAGRRLADALRAANRSLFDRAAARPEWRGLGTSATVASIVGHQLTVAHVGDTRAYVLRAGALSQVSADHTLLAALLAERREVPAEEMQRYQNIVLRTIGLIEEVEVDKSSLELRDGDAVLLCTDGLWRQLDDARLAAIVSMHPDPDAACAALLDAANAAGGHDNATAVVVAV
ncbi:MAG TPA: protein phosphatase 2C domain-containing protein [Kofleriaceae bacterium]|nr:protein phosphatase 2C domain-containing protein [Kofleriaceae bacterium]